MSPSNNKAGSGPAEMIARMICVYKCIPHDVIAILTRFIIGVVFWLSGRTKVDGFEIKASTFYLFQQKYGVPLIPPDIAAYMATTAEHVFPVLLWLGLATRLSATALLFMTLVIQIFVYPNAYVTHGLWAIGLLYLMKYGPGRLSLDHLISSRSMPE